MNEWRAGTRRGRFVSWVGAHRLPLVLVTLGAVLVVMAGGTLTLSGSSGDDLPRGLRRTHTVTFVASGGATAADVTYSADDTRDVTLVRGTALPWRLDVEVKNGPRTSYQLLVEADADGGSVSCEIQVDRRTVQTQRSTGTHAIASCQFTP